MKILLFYHDACGLGDFYLLFPFFKSLKHIHKEDEMTLIVREELQDLIADKGWFDEILDVHELSFPINEFDKCYNFDIQKLGPTLFYKKDMHFWDIMESNLNIPISPRTYDIFKLNITSEDIAKVDGILDSLYNSNSKNIVLHTGHNFKFPFGKTPSFEWWNNIITEFPEYNFIQTGIKEVEVESRLLSDFKLLGKNCYDCRGELSLKQVAYLIERCDTFIAIDSIVAHLSLHSMKKGIVIWGSSNKNTHGHSHNINLEASRPCKKSPCVDLTGFLVPDDRNQNCCLVNENEHWPNLEQIKKHI